ncbi:porin [Variovorax paradoxus]|nr:porin [Variovorax paradoxus]
MKKTLTAIAALAVTGLAAAQSSVTLFGVVDAGVSYQSATSRDAVTGASSKQSRTSLSNSGYNSSRLGFRGTEDLGGGLAASFWLEAPITNDDGATGISTFNRRSTVSLSGGFGEVRLGRDYTPTFWNDTVFDPFGTNGSGTNVISSVSGSSALGNTNYTRASNSIGYFLPPNLGGFYGQLQYSLHENTSTSGDSATNSNAGRYVGGRFGWANGPLDVAVSLGESIAVDTAALTRTVRTANLGASYDLGPVKLFGELSSVQIRFETSLARSHDSYNGYLLGATVPVGAGLIRASYSEVRYNEGAAGLAGEDPRARKLALGYVHNLSKRTALYATVARVNNRNDAAYTGSLSSAITTGYSSNGVSYSGVPRSSTGYDFGIRHAF